MSSVITSDRIALPPRRFCTALCTGSGSIGVHQISLHRIEARLSDDAFESGLEPLDSVLLVDLVRLSHGGLASSPSRDTGTGSGHAAVKVHAINTDRRVVLDAQVDVFRNTKPKVTSL